MLYNNVYNNRLVCVEGVVLGLAFRVRLFYMLSTSKKNYARSGKGLNPLESSAGEEEAYWRVVLQPSLMWQQILQDLYNNNGQGQLDY